MIAIEVKRKKVSPETKEKILKEFARINKEKQEFFGGDVKLPDHAFWTKRDIPTLHWVVSQEGIQLKEEPKKMFPVTMAVFHQGYLDMQECGGLRRQKKIYIFRDDIKEECLKEVNFAKL